MFRRAKNAGRAVKKCTVCLKNFLPMGSQKICSPACLAKSKVKIVRCRMCKRKFEANKNRKYCRPECANKYYLLVEYARRIPFITVEGAKIVHPLRDQIQQIYENWVRDTALVTRVYSRDGSVITTIGIPLPDIKRRLSEAKQDVCVVEGGQTFKMKKNLYLEDLQLPVHATVIMNPNLLRTKALKAVGWIE